MEKNGCGKTAVINALRLLFREQEAFYSFSTDDFYCSADRTDFAEEIEIDADISELNEDEKITFLSWCDADFNAQLPLTFSLIVCFSPELGSSIFLDIHSLLPNVQGAL